MNLAEPIRTALLGETIITTLLQTYQSSKPIFTRRPVPDTAPMPLIIVSPDVNIFDEDGVHDQRPVIRRDVSVYGKNDKAENYRTVEVIAYAVRDLFHRNREAIVVPDWDVIDVRAAGPRPAPVDEDQTVGRLVELTVRLARKS